MLAFLSRHPDRHSPLHPVLPVSTVPALKTLAKRLLQIVVTVRESSSVNLTVLLVPSTSGNIYYGIIVMVEDAAGTGYWGRPGEEVFQEALQIGGGFDVGDWLRVQVKSNARFGRLSDAA